MRGPTRRSQDRPRRDPDPGLHAGRHPGHGQGDQILSDLLLGAAQAASQGCGLDRRGTTARFFAEWTPSRIRTSSFGMVFTARELGMKASERVDLFVICFTGNTAAPMRMCRP